MYFKKINSTIILSVSILIFLTSCSIRRDIKIKLSDDLIKESVQVDLIGTDEKTLQKIDFLGFSDYWQLEGIEHKFNKDKISVNFPPYEYSVSKSITKENKIWSQWWDNDCDYLFIAVDTPFLNSKHEQWKETIPMQCYWWFNFWSDRNLYIDVNKNGLTVKNK